MRLKKILIRGVAVALTALSLTVSVSAMKLIGAGNIYSALGPDSKISVGISLSEEDAAMRLYYLDMITGSGTNKDGSVVFDLERGLNRVEAAVFAVRLMGAEKEALEKQYEHPFTDVPEWASAYVGYIYSCGLLDDLLKNNEEKLFEPTLGETVDRFSAYMLYVLGYRMEDGDFRIPMAAKYARRIGIHSVGIGVPMTRGDAVISMYNTLRTTYKNSRRAYSDILVEKGVISYSDAVFLLWNRNVEETEEYMTAMGYRTEWVVPNGYYKIRTAVSGKMLNVAMDHANQDFDGIDVTLWQDTGDLTQTFRLERTERGTYYIYSAASRGGYGRVVGSPSYNQRSALYRTNSHNAMEFYIEGNADGSWTIVSASDGSVLTAADFERNGSAVIFGERSNTKADSWIFERQGVINEDGEEMAIFVAESLIITQGAYDTYSHMHQNALDMTPTERAVRAPFNATVVRVDPYYYACNGVWIQSNNKVRYADGTYDYMTVLFMHDYNISDLYVGRALVQGEYFYQIGAYGISAGEHVHVACYRGKYNNGMRLGSGNVFAEDAFFVPDDTYIYNDYGLDWTVLSLAD